MDTLSFPKLGLEFTLNKTAFTIFGLDIQWYAVLISLGAALAFVYIVSKSREHGLHPDNVLDCILGGMIGGIIGARLFYVIFQWDLYKDNLIDIFNTRQGGLAIYGGLIGGILVGYFICKWRKVKFFPIIDLVGLGFLIGQCIGRWGNFVNIETFGSNTNLPWGMTSNGVQYYLSSVQQELSAIGVTVDPTQPVHPCFLYESLWCALGFFILNAYRKKRKFDGEIFLMYLAWYGAGRFFIESLRTDSLLAGSVRISQLLSAIFCVIAIIVIIVIRGQIKRSNDPNYMPLYVNTDESKQLLEEIDKKLAEKANKNKKQDKSDSKSEETEEEQQEDSNTEIVETESEDEKLEKDINDIDND